MQPLVPHGVLSDRVPDAHRRFGFTGNPGMIVLRFPTPTHFRIRALEWGLAGIMLNVGLVLIQPAETFSNPAFRNMASWAPEWVWALGCLAVAGVRLAALWRNGAWEPSPWLRLGTSVVSALFWLQVLLGVVASSILPLGLAFFPAFVAADLYSVWRAAQDAALSREARRAKPEAPVILPPIVQ